MADNSENIKDSLTIENQKNTQKPELHTEKNQQKKSRERDWWNRRRASQI